MEYRGDDYGFTVGFHRHCGEGLGTGVSANAPHGGTYDEEKIRESYESGRRPGIFCVAAGGKIAVRLSVLLSSVKRSSTAYLQA